MIYLLILCSLAGIIIANRFALNLRDIQTITKASLLRSGVKVVVGISVGFVLAVMMNWLHVQSSLAIILIAIGALLTGAVTSLFIYQFLLKKYLMLDFSVSQLIKSYVVEMVVMLALAIGSTGLLFVSMDLSL